MWCEMRAPQHVCCCRWRPGFKLQVWKSQPPTVKPQQPAAPQQEEMLQFRLKLQLIGRTWLTMRTWWFLWNIWRFRVRNLYSRRGFRLRCSDLLCLNGARQLSLGGFEAAWSCGPLLEMFVSLETWRREGCLRSNLEEVLVSIATLRRSLFP